MKNIISTTGSKILFNINRDRKLTIDTVVPIQVSEPEFKLLKDRLGNQLKVVSIENQNIETKTDTKIEENPDETETKDGEVEDNKEETKESDAGAGDEGIA